VGLARAQRVPGGVGVGQVGEELADVAGERMRRPEQLADDRIHATSSKLPDNQETNHGHRGRMPQVDYGLASLSCQITKVIPQPHATRDWARRLRGRDLPEVPDPRRQLPADPGRTGAKFASDAPMRVRRVLDHG
jgi:hypothetical protein